MQIWCRFYADAFIWSWDWQKDYASQSRLGLCLLPVSNQRAFVMWGVESMEPQWIQIPTNTNYVEKRICCYGCSSRIEILITVIHEYLSSSWVETTFPIIFLTLLQFNHFFSNLIFLHFLVSVVMVFTSLLEMPLGREALEWVVCLVQSGPIESHHIALRT